MYYFMEHHADWMVMRYNQIWHWLQEGFVGRYTVCSSKSMIPEATENRHDSPKHQIQFGWAQNLVSPIMQLENPLDLVAQSSQHYEQYLQVHLPSDPYSAAQPNFIVHRLKTSKLAPKPWSFFAQDIIKLQQHFSLGWIFHFFQIPLGPLAFSKCWTKTSQILLLKHSRASTSVGAWGD